MDNKMTCGRREDDGMANAASPFKYAGEGLDYYRDDDTCSYCGSLNPDILMSRLEDGDIEIGPTDKNYKIYVHNSGGTLFKQSYRDCPEGAVCSGPGDCTHWVTRPRNETKFYFQHLSEDQRSRFIELLNEKKLKIGFPGHFYRLPYFIKVDPK